jgi:hypothetical protein
MMENSLSWTNVERQVMIASGEKYPSLGISTSPKEVMVFMDRRSLGNAGKVMSNRWMTRKCGVDPLRNVLGNAHVVLSLEITR